MIPHPYESGISETNSCALRLFDGSIVQRRARKKCIALSPTEIVIAAARAENAIEEEQGRVPTFGEQRTGGARRSRSRREAAPKAVAIEESRHRRPMPCLPNSEPWSPQGQNAHISDASPATSIHEAPPSGQMVWNQRMAGSYKKLQDQIENWFDL